MKRQVRKGVFETNSSSTHSLTMCSSDKFEEWEKGSLLFDEWEEKFIDADCLSDKDKRSAEKLYEGAKNEFCEEWSELPEEEKKKIYLEYAKEHNLIPGHAKTYKEWEDDYYLESFVYEYETQSGDKVVAFGKYGYQ